MYRLLFVCVCFFVCVFVRLRIFPPRIKLASSNFARPFIGIQGRESTISVNFAPPEAKIGRIDVHNDYLLAPEYMIARRVDVGSACVDIRLSPTSDLLI